MNGTLKVYQSFPVDLYIKVCRAVMVDHKGERAIARYFGIHRNTRQEDVPICSATRLSENTGSSFSDASTICGDNRNHSGS